MVKVLLFNFSGIDFEGSSLLLPTCFASPCWCTREMNGGVGGWTDGEVWEEILSLMLMWGAIVKEGDRIAQLVLERVSVVFCYLFLNGYGG